MSLSSALAEIRADLKLYEEMRSYDPTSDKIALGRDDDLFPLPIRTEKQLASFLWRAWGVRIPAKRVCPTHCSPWEVFADCYFGRTPVAVLKASRGFGGKSFLAAVLGTTEAVTLACDVNVLGGSGQQAIRILEGEARLWSAPGAPYKLLASEPAQRHTRLTNGATIQALMASQTSVRGPHPARLRVDEVDAMKLGLLDAALGQPMDQGGVVAQTLLASTHQNDRGTMSECIKRSAEMKGWRFYEYCYRETMEPHGWLTRSQVARSKATMPAALWRTEVEGQEPNPEGRAIDPDAVEAMFRTSLGEYAGRDGQYIEVEAPLEQARYSTGADWARKVDRTIITTIRWDVKPARVVAYEQMQRRPWPQMIGRFDERVKRYPGAAAHDGTGIGDVVHGTMKTAARAVMFVGRERQDLLTEYIEAVERGEIASPKIETAYSEHKYASNDDVYAGGTGHLPDSLASYALAYFAGRKRAAWA